MVGTIERKFKIWSVSGEYDNGFMVLRYFKYDYSRSEAEQYHNLECWLKAHSGKLMWYEIYIVD